MSGERDYVDNKLDEFISKLISESSRFNLDKVLVDKSSASYLVMTEDEITRLDKDSLALAELKLCSYALSIQMYINRANAIYSWAERLLKLVVASKYDDYDKYMQYEARKDMVICHNTYAKKLFDIMQEQKMKIEEFQYLSQSIQKVAEAFGRMARIRGADRQ